MSELGPHGLYAYIWRRDKERLLHADSRFPVNFLSSTPTEDDVCAIVTESERRQQESKHNVVLHASNVRDITDFVIDEVEAMFGAKFDPYPDIVLVTPKEYMSFLKQAGNNDYPPSSCMPEDNEIMFPTKRLLRIDENTIIQRPYDVGFVEHEMFFQYAHVMLRQLRFEWQDGFSDICNELPEHNLAGVQLFVGTLNAYVRDQALTKYKTWAVHGVAHKLRYIYIDDRSMSTYAGLVTLLEDTNHPRTLGQVASLDVCMYDENTAFVNGFYESHPKLDWKQVMFHTDKEKGD